MIRYFYSGLLLLCSSFSIVQAEPVLDAKQAFQQGYYEQAMLHWQAVLKTTTLTTNNRLEAQRNIARLYRYLGLYHKARSVLNTALPVAQQTGDSTDHAQLLNESSKLLMSQGTKKREQALQQGEQALKLAREASSPLVLVEVLNHWGSLLTAEYDYEGALEAYSEALTILPTSQEESTTLSGKILINQAQTLFLVDVEEDETFKASITALEKALPAAQNEWSDTYGQVLGLIAISQQAQKIQKRLTGTSARLTHLAYQALITARRLAERSGNAKAKAYANGYLGQLYEQAKRYKEALFLTRQALFFTQQTREESFMSYLWQWQMARILNVHGDQPGAIAAYQQAMTHLRPVRAQLTTTGYFDVTEESFRDKIAPIYFELADLLLQQAHSTQDIKQRERLLKQARQVIESFKEVELRDYFESDCIDLQSQCTDLEQILDAHTAVLYPIPLADRLELLLQRRDGLVQATVPISEKTLREQVVSLLSPLRRHPDLDELMRSRGERAVAGIKVDEDVCTPLQRGGNTTPSQAPTQDLLAPAQTLYSWLIEPLRPHLHDIQTLVIIPDGTLRTMPFAALHDGQQFIIQKYALAVAPGLCLSEQQIRQWGDKRILLGGLSDSVQGFSSLPCAKYELDALHTLFKEAPTPLLNQSFSLSNVRDNIQQQDYSIVHIASHGQFNADLKNTFILMYDDKLSMDKLERLIGYTTIKDKPVELLTLSACETAVGDDRAALGLAGVALKAGVKSALASLWKVDDEATPAVIIEFYRQLQNPTISKAKALQNAQKMMLTDKNYARYRHPYYWSAFLLIGNWQ